ncbi:MAG TPA: rRNA maturation RNase YbeY [Niabella sp.]|nr:rRNA maturation RNase YbeY [Niabella sp.]
MHLKEFIINFHFKKSTTLRNRLAIKRFISSRLLEHKRTGCEINYVFCSDEDLLAINRQHLDHDYYTDIITFDLSETSESKHLISDIYISTDRVKENAALTGTTFSSELLRVMFHGILHLIGYKDKTDKEQKRMREVEDEWLQRFFK